MASLINVRLNRGDATPWGFRLQGGKDFGTPLLIQKVNGNSLAEKAGLQVGDAVIRVNGTDVFNLRHKDAQDIIVRSGNNIEVTVQRGGNATWKPAITPVGSTPAPSSHLPSKPAPVTKTSLAAGRPKGPSNIGTAHNLAPRPFNSPQVNGEPVKSIVNKQYNTPVNIYSEETIAETLSAQAEVLAGGVLGVNFKKNEKGYDAEKSEVFKMVQEAEREPKSPEPVEAEQGGVVVPPPIAGLRHVSAPEHKPAAPSTPSGGGTGGQNLCAECERLIVGVFVRIKDKNLHVECFKCATCGSSLKNVGYYNINNKLYCDVHAKMVARQNPPTPNLEAIAIPPGGRAPAGTISAALASTAPSSSPQSPQPSTIAPLPFHAPRLGPSHVNPPRPVSQQQSSPSTPSTTAAPKPFGSVSAPAPFTPPAAPPAPAAPFYTKQQPELPPSDKFAWPPKQDDTQPVATATPLYISPSVVPESSAPAEKSVLDISSPEYPACIDKGKRMSICSKEVCKIAEERKTFKSDDLKSVKEEFSSNRPESPVPFNKHPSIEFPPKNDSVESAQKQDLQALDYSSKNVNFEEKKTNTNITQNVAAGSLNVSAQQGSSSNQNVDIVEEDGFTRTRKVKVEESFSQSSTAYLSVRSSKTISRCITPEICEIMDKPRGSPSLFPADRPATPQQVVVFPPEIPVFVPLPHSRTGTPQPHALQRILSEEFGLKSKQPPVPIEEIKSEKVDSLKSFEELFTKSQVDEIVQMELQKYKNKEIKSSATSETGETKLASDQKEYAQNTLVSNSEKSDQLEVSNSYTQAATSEMERFENRKFDKSQLSSVGNVEVKSSIRQEDWKEIKETALSSQLYEENIELPKTSCFLKKEERPYSPVQPPHTIIRPKPQPVPLPSEVKPYTPPPPATEDETSQKPRIVSREEACQSPMISALTVAPNRPYSSLPVPTFKPISLDDLPSPPEGSQPLSLLSALTIAPDTPFTPFPDPIDVSKQSPPKFTKAFNSEPHIQANFSKSVPLTTSSASSTTISSTSTTPSYDANKLSTKSVNESAFKPVVQKPVLPSQPQPLPLPESVKISQSIPSESFPPVSNELKSDFIKQSQSTAHQSISTQQYSSSAVSLVRSSPSGIRKPDLIPYYQQNIGEIPLAHRPKSPVPHAIKAPLYKSPPESKRSVSEQIKSSSSFSRNSGYVSSSIYGQTFTAGKQETNTVSSGGAGGGAGGVSDNLLPYYQQNIGEIPLAHRPKSPVPHAIKAPSVDPIKPARPSSTPIKPSPLAGKAPETLSRSKQVFKPETKYQNVFSTPPEPVKPLNKTLPHFSHPTTANEKQKEGAPWIVKKQNDLQNQKQFSQPKEKSKFPDPIAQPKLPLKLLDPHPQTKESIKLPDFKSGAVPSQQSSSQTNYKPAAGFIPPSQNKPSGPPTTSVPPAGAGAPGNKSATFAGSSAPRRGRGTLNPSVGPGARVPLCGSCSRQIRGPFITALGKIWCPEHFMCANAQCRRPLQDIGFVEESTGLYCEYCFEQYLAPNCNKCGAKIKGDCLNAIGKHFHPECFCCAYCGKLFGNSPFFLEDALPYCENDWNELFTTKCFTCGFPIEAGDRWVEALSNNYHSQCFNCTMCKKNLEGQSFYAKAGRPFCKNHAR